MKPVIIRCTYRAAENPRGTYNLTESDFMVQLQINKAGTVASWAVDDRTACFYTDLANYDATEILFEGSEIKGQTGSLVIDRNQSTFIQKSDVNGEWLTLRGTCEEITLSARHRRGGFPNA